VVGLLAADALRERFDRTVGIGGWGVAYAPLEAGAIACHVTVAGVTKGAVAAAALAGGPAATAEAAFARAAELFGLRAPLPSGAVAWVPWDPESLQPLHLPEVDLASGAPRSSEGAAGMGAAVPQEASRATPAGGGVASAADHSSAAAEKPRADGPVEKPTGQQMIDRLVDRLKDEGQGLAAARLLVRYGGYGKDPDTARELYAQLRALLRGEAVAGATGGGPA
jgi:hypothetical protein